MRLEHERRALYRKTGLTPPALVAGRNLFIDCGGFDGCSALKFLLMYPEYEAVTFEPNADLWNYYEGIPTRLIKKAVYTHDGTVPLTIDPIDADGSSVIKEKPIDKKGRVANEDCPVRSVPCVDLSVFVRDCAKQYDRIILKLDVEGAEYAILDKMLADGTLTHIAHLYCEFHGAKMGMDPEQHERLVEQVKQHVPVESWDAISLSFSREETETVRSKRRADLIKIIDLNRKRSRFTIDDDCT